MIDSSEDQAAQPPTNNESPSEGQEELPPGIDERLFQTAVQKAISNEMPNFEEVFSDLEVMPKLADEPDFERKPISDAKKEFLEDEKLVNTESTTSGYDSTLRFFEEFCENAGIESLHELTGQQIKDFRDWRREEFGWKLTTEETQMTQLRKFLRYGTQFDWVAPELPKQVPIPNVDADDESRDVVVTHEEVVETLDYLAKYEYASFPHVEWLILGNTGCRLSALRALDLGDYDTDDETGESYLAFRHRPESDTPLKNDASSEREVTISEEVQEVLDDYIDNVRPDVTDNYGREPLLATKHGRPAKSTIRKHAYMWTRPCELTGSCPLNRDIEECCGTKNGEAYSCPDSRSTHPIRRGFITHLLIQGVMPHVISEMCDVSPGVIKKHYDVRSDSEKRQMASMWIEMLSNHLADEFSAGFSVN